MSYSQFSRTRSLKPRSPITCLAYLLVQYYDVLGEVDFDRQDRLASPRDSFEGKDSTGRVEVLCLDRVHPSVEQALRV